LKDSDHLSANDPSPSPGPARPRPTSTKPGEEVFHDAWAQTEAAGRIDVRNANEACTAPELRYIHRRLGDVTGRKILDIGCGRGETSVYFALKGAAVTALDISSGMLKLTSELAQRNRTALRVVQADAHSLGLAATEQFDVIHAANVLHHVNLRQALPEILAHLHPGGTFVSWDPLAYNPLIQVYRKIAQATRTEDEHPLERADIQFITRQFRTVEIRWFWLSTLLIFVLMATWQRRNPNRHRYWKVVVDEGERWARLYWPLARCDEFLLRVLPPLRWWCWNVVVIGEGPVTPASE
jgi:SAM-dependent methyltransferase